jgi:hypothetical protein
MYNQFQNSAFQSSFGSTGFAAGNQYRGQEVKYQPVGYVQSQYNSSVAPNAYGTQFQTAAPQYGYQNSPYHTANYRGNQPGHDAYLRADSVQPAQAQYGIGAPSAFTSSVSFGAPSTFGSQGIGSQGISSSIYNQNAGIGSQQYGQSYSSYQSSPYHTASYRGNQPGHDAYLRADSVNPAQSQYGIGATSFNSFPTSNFQSQNQFGSSSSFGFGGNRQF